MFCEQCGEKIQPGAVFCGECGAKVEAENEMHPLNFGNSDQSRDQDTVTVSSSQNVGPTFRNVHHPEQEQSYNHFPGNQFGNPVQLEKEKRTSTPLMLVLGGIIVLLAGGIIWGVVTLVNINKQNEDNIYIAPAVNNTQAAQEIEEKSGGLFEEEVEIKSNTPETDQNSDAAAQVTPIPTEAPSQSQNSAYAVSSDYVIADSSTRYITAGDLDDLSAWEIKIARNEIYARKGRMFESSDLDSYFRGKSWYVPSVPADRFTDSYLDTIEFENVKFIVKYEKEHGINQ